MPNANDNTSDPSDQTTSDSALDPIQFSYERALAALSPNSPVIQEISDSYDRYVDTYIHEGPAQRWHEYFLEDLDSRRAYGVLYGDDEHLNTNTLDPETGRSRAAATDDSDENSDGSWDELSDVALADEDSDDDAADHGTAPERVDELVDEL